MAIASTAAVEVNGSGGIYNAGYYNAARAGATTDYTYPTPFVVNYTDLAATLATSAAPQVTSVARPFTASDIGNHMMPLGAPGTNWLVTNIPYEIVAVSGGVATLDRACGSAATLTGGSMNLGGAQLEPAKAAAGMVAGNTMHWKKALNPTLVTVNTANVPGGRLLLPTATSAAFPVRISGYNTTRNDRPGYGSRPQLNADGIAGGSAASFITANAYNFIEYVSLSASVFAIGSGSWNAITGVLNTTIHHCDCSGFSSTSRTAFVAGMIYECYAEYCQIAVSCAVNTEIVNCFFKNCGSFVMATTANIHSVATNCLFARTDTTFSAGGVADIVGTNNSSVSYESCTMYGGFFRLQPATAPPPARMRNCLQYGCVNYGIASSLVDPIPSITINRNAFGGNGLGNFNGVLPTSGATQMVFNAVLLIADPFNNAAAGDYSLNNTTGGGDACMQGGALTFPNSTLQTLPDLGAIKMGVTAANMTAIAAQVRTALAPELTRLMLALPAAAPDTQTGLPTTGSVDTNGDSAYGTLYGPYTVTSPVPPVDSYTTVNSPAGQPLRLSLNLALTGGVAPDAAYMQERGYALLSDSAGQAVGGNRDGRIGIKVDPVTTGAVQVMLPGEYLATAGTYTLLIYNGVTGAPYGGIKLVIA